MKRILGVFMIGMIIGLTQAQAQEADENTFTDEELTKYATVMKWAEDEKQVLSSLVRDSVKVWLDGTELTASLYNTLSKAKKKGTIEEVEASEAQLATFNEIADKIDGKKSTFTEVYKTKIKEDIGAGLYNRLKKALKSDETVKTRYEAILANLDNAESDEEPAESDDTENK